MATSVRTLIGKFTPTCLKATERAAALCVSMHHHEVDVEHLCLALLEQPTSDFVIVLQNSGIDVAKLQAQLEQSIRSFKSDCTRTPVLSTRLPEIFEHAWLIASLETHTAKIRSGHIMLAALTDPEIGLLLRNAAPLFEAVKLDGLKHKFGKITAGSIEATEATSLPQEAVDEGAPAALSGLGKTPALDQFTINLTQRARDGLIDPVIGREPEIRQMVDILTRRRQNNPILTGEAGVGKTAVVEGLALRIVAGDVPESLRPVALYTLDMGLLQAGASVKGEFENRLKSVIDEVKKSDIPIILFIDEAHTMIGAGGQAGQSDAANLLKPALARGELRTIAATTWSEYKLYFEKDAALARRFQVVKVEEPSEELAADMLRGMVPLLEKHFQIRILDEAVQAASRLSHRYISGRQLPDKAVSVLDTACARVALGKSALPAPIEDLLQSLTFIKMECAALKKEQAVDGKHGSTLEALEGELRDKEAALASLQARYQEELALVEQINILRAQLEQSAAEPTTAEPTKALPAAAEGAASSKRKRAVAKAGTADSAAPADPTLSAQRKALHELQGKLRDLQGENPLIQPQVDAQVIAEVISAWTGIPLGRMVDNEIKTILDLKTRLAERIIGQDHALEAIAQRIRTSRAGLEDPNKPKGVFLFVGPSGVGKTETALALAETLYGGEHKIITINMSEYQEAHTVSGLKGSPPGYVGYGQGGILTEAVRRQPYSVVLLDEVEKAHPDVLELFFQVFDKGVLDDAEGREIDFRNTLIILTSNVGATLIMQSCTKQEEEKPRPSPEELYSLIAPQLYKSFKPAFLGRLRTVPYYPIDDDSLVRIIVLKLRAIAKRVQQNHQAAFTWDDNLVDAVYARCTEVDSGARNVDHILNGSLLPEIAERVLSYMSENKPITKIHVSAQKNGKFKYKVD